MAASDCPVYCYGSATILPPFALSTSWLRLATRKALRRWDVVTVVVAVTGPALVTVAVTVLVTVMVAVAVAAGVQWWCPYSAGICQPTIPAVNRTPALLGVVPVLVLLYRFPVGPTDIMVLYRQ